MNRGRVIVLRRVGAIQVLLLRALSRMILSSRNVIIATYAPRITIAFRYRNEVILALLIAMYSEPVLLLVLAVASEECSSFPRSITNKDDAAAGAEDSAPSEFVVGSAEVGVLILTSANSRKQC